MVSGDPTATIRAMCYEEELWAGTAGETALSV